MARTRGCLWLAAGVVVAILAGVIAFVLISRSGVNQASAPAQPPPGGPTVPVVVATQNIPVRTLLSADQLELRDIPVASAPPGSIATVADAAGKLAITQIFPGEIVLSQRLVDPNYTSGDGRLALVASQGEVLMAFPIGDLMSSINVLQPGDHVDLLFTLNFPTERDPALGTSGAAEQATFNLLQNKIIAAVVTPQPGGSPQALLLTISPQEALTLKYVLDAGGIADIVIRAPGDEGPVETQPVDIDYLLNRYQIPSEIGR